MKLGAVHAEMDAAHAKSVGTHCCRNRQQWLRPSGLTLIGQRLEFRDNGAKRQQFARRVGRQPVGCRRQVVRIRKVGRKQGRHFAAMRLGFRQPGVNRRSEVTERSHISREPFCLFEQAKADARRPADVGAAVHIVADPSGEPPRHGPELLPAIGPMARRDVQQDAIHCIACFAGAAHCSNRLAMFTGQRNGRALGFGKAQCGGAGIAAACRVGHGIALGRGQQEGRVAGKDGMEQWLAPARAIALETKRGG